MGRADCLVLGDWNVVCYQCGFKRKASTMVKNWQGFYLCPEHNEPRQTQDFVRAIPDNQTVPWSQPTPAITYTYTNVFLGKTSVIPVNFQLGSGIYPVSVSQVKLDGAPFGAYTTNGLGLITLIGALAAGIIVTASGMETVP